MYFEKCILLRLGVPGLIPILVLSDVGRRHTYRYLNPSSKPRHSMGNSSCKISKSNKTHCESRDTPRTKISKWRTPYVLGAALQIPHHRHPTVNQSDAELRSIKLACLRCTQHALNLPASVDHHLTLLLLRVSGRSFLWLDTTSRWHHEHPGTSLCRDPFASSSSFVPTQKDSITMTLVHNLGWRS
jgi:hypothetical protein